MRTNLRFYAANALLAVTATAVVMAGGSESPSFDLVWHTIDAGGGECFGAGTLALAGTIGQPDAGPTLVGGTFELDGGFWPGAVEPAADCAPDIAGNDGLVNIDDLLVVINHWGQGPGSPGDIQNNDGVNIDDLLAVVNAWGACP